MSKQDLIISDSLVALINSCYASNSSIRLLVLIIENNNLIVYKSVNSNNSDWNSDWMIDKIISDINIENINNNKEKEVENEKPYYILYFKDLLVLSNPSIFEKMFGGKKVKVRPTVLITYITGKTNFKDKISYTLNKNTIRNIIINNLPDKKNEHLDDYQADSIDDLKYENYKKYENSKNNDNESKELARANSNDPFKYPKNKSGDLSTPACPTGSAKHKYTQSSNNNFVVDKDLLLAAVNSLSPGKNNHSRNPSEVPSFSGSHNNATKIVSPRELVILKPAQLNPKSIQLEQVVLKSVLATVKENATTNSPREIEQVVLKPVLVTLKENSAPNSPERAVVLKPIKSIDSISYPIEEVDEIKLDETFKNEPLAVEELIITEKVVEKNESLSNENFAVKEDLVDGAKEENATEKVNESIATNIKLKITNEKELLNESTPAEKLESNNNESVKSEELKKNEESPLDTQEVTKIESKEASIEPSVEI